MRFRLILIIIIVFVAALVLTACGSRQESSTLTERPDDQSSTQIPETDISEGDEAAHDDSEEQETEVHQQDADHEEGDEHAVDEHTEEVDHNEEGEDHGAGAHGIPVEAAAVPNPLAADASSIEAGQVVYTASCAVCHGDTGVGDGAGGAALDPPPANLQADHVQVLSDGALFYTIHSGVEGTAMPGWSESLSDDDIWNVVNYIRTYKE